MAEPPFTIAILLPQTPPAPLFAALPKSDERVHIVLVPIEADIEAVDVSSITAILWVPSTPAARLTALFDRVGAEQLRWTRCQRASITSANFSPRASYPRLCHSRTGAAPSPRHWPSTLWPFKVICQFVEFHRKNKSFGCLIRWSILFRA